MFVLGLQKIDRTVERGRRLKVGRYGLVLPLELVLCMAWINLAVCTRAVQVPLEVNDHWSDIKISVSYIFVFNVICTK